MKLGKYTRRLNYLLFFLLFVLQTIDNYCREQFLGIKFITLSKNITLLLIVVVFIFEIISIQKKEKFTFIFLDEFKYIIKLTVCFGLLSGYFMIKNNGFEFETAMGLIKLLIPVLVAFVLLNIMPLKDIYNFMAIILIIMFIAYVTTCIDNISFANIRTINLLSSHSPFESTYFSPAAMSFCLFFCYYRKNKLYTYLSVIFTIMTFKRIMVIYAIFLILFGGIISKWKKVPKVVSTMFIICFSIISFVYIQLMLGNIEDLAYKYLGINLETFTMGRSFFMRYIVRSFVSTGFMSSTVLFRSMEMDLPMIYVEMGILSVIATIYYFTKIAKDNWYNLIIISFCLLQLLTSHWFDITYFWIIAYITIGCIQYKKLEYLNTKKKRIRIRL